MTRLTQQREQRSLLPKWMTRGGSAAAVAIAALGLTVAPANVMAQDDTEWEYESGEGYHEEEWYDPSDWLNDDGQIDYEYDDWQWGTYDYDDRYGYDTTPEYEYEYENDWDNLGWEWEGEYEYDTYDYDDNYVYSLYTYDLSDQQNQQGQQAQRNQQGQQQGMQNQRQARGQQGQQQWRQQQAQRNQQNQFGQRQRQQHRWNQGNQQNQRQQFGQQNRQQRYSANQGSFGQQNQQRNQRQFGQQQGQQQNQQRQQMTQRQMRTLTGQVQSLRVLRPQSGQPEAVVLEFQTQDGQSRRVALGDAKFVGQNLPRIQPGQTIQIAGEQANVNGRQLFNAKQVRSQDGSFDIPQYQFNRTVQGQIKGVRQIAMNNGQIQALVAKVKTQDGQSMNVLLGSPDTLRQRGVTFKADEPIQVRGYTRDLNGQRTFLIQDVQLRGQSLSGQKNQQSQSQRQFGQQQGQQNQFNQQNQQRSQRQNNWRNQRMQDQQQNWNSQNQRQQNQNRNWQN